MTAEEKAEFASLFMNGGSQAVRLPKPFRFEGKIVRIRRVGARGVLLEPVEKAEWPAGYWERLASAPPLPDDFDRPPEIPSPERDRVIVDFGRAE